MQGPADFSAELILICNSLDAGGIERVVSTLANEWSRRGRKVSVVTLHDRHRFYKLDPEVHHVVVEQQGATRLSDFLRKIRTLLIELRHAKPWLITLLGPGIYYFLSEQAYRTHFRLYLAFEALGLRGALRRIDSSLIVSFGTSVNVITLKACKGMGRRVVISERNDPARLIELWEKLWHKYYKQADVVTANTQSALHDMQAFVAREKLAFVPNPLTVPNGNGDGNGHHSSVTAKGSPFVLTVGRLVEDKAQDILLDAFAQTGSDLNHWRLAILGEGRLGEPLRAQAKKLGIAERVDWHGVVRDPYYYYRQAHVFALPSRVEGTPNALLEAMSCGLPVVVSDGAPGPLELIEDEVTGLVVPVNDSKKLAAALRRLGNDHELRARLGSAARERVREYDLPRALATWESVVGLSA
jgi:glycosyltransferase involved in cell wall biosynthesis